MTVALPAATSPVGLVLARLETHGCRPRRNQSGWEARCPGHEDRNPSLCIGAGRV